ncbi:MAG: methionine synthase [bacterium]
MKNFKPHCLPTGIGSIPHKDARAGCEFVLANFKEIPFWPQLPKRSFLENMYVQYCEGLPCVKIEEEKMYLDTSTGLLEEAERFYENFLSEDINKFAIGPEYAQGLYRLLDMKDSLRECQYIKGQITGPISFGMQVTDENKKAIFYNDTLRDIVVKNLLRKAQWQEKVLSKFSKPIIMFLDEPYLSAFGSAFFNVSREQIVDALEEIFSNLTSITGVHCCGNTDWSILLDTSVDIISLDAYNFGDNLFLYSEKLKRFLERGGVLAWGIVPTDEVFIKNSSFPLISKNKEEKTKNEEKKMKLFNVLKRIIIRMEDLGFKEEEILNFSLITPSCGVGTLDVELAEDIFMMTGALATAIK